MNFFFLVEVAIRTSSPGRTKGTNTVLPSKCAKPSPPYTSFSIRTSIRVAFRFGGCEPRPGASGQVEQTQARKSIPLPEAFLHILTLELRKLRRTHFPAIGRELMVHLAADVEEKFFRRSGSQRCCEFFFQDR